jgi:hypothetical protein
MGSLFDSFKYESGGATTLANSVCFFLKEQIAFGRSIPPPPVVEPQYIFGATFPF